MRWLSTTTGFTAFIGDDAIANILLDQQSGEWVATVYGGGVSRHTDIDAAKAWVVGQVTE